MDKELALWWTLVSVLVWGASIFGYLSFSNNSVLTPDLTKDQSVDFELILPDAIEWDEEIDKNKDLSDTVQVDETNESIRNKIQELNQFFRNNAIKDSAFEDFEIQKEVLDIKQNSFPSSTQLEKSKVSDTQNILPPSVQLDLPFYAQAPDANRNQPRQDACEEASIILPAYWLNKKPLSKERFRQDILNLVSLQNQMFGSYVDTTIAQTQQLYDTYYGIWTTKILHDPTEHDLRRELAYWHPIVAPFAGKLLGNPNYSNWGPRYHMMVLVGYDHDWYFITHDVGTRQGAYYRYSQEVIFEALHDFVPVSIWPITIGAKRVLVLSNLR